MNLLEVVSSYWLSLSASVRRGTLNSLVYFILGCFSKGLELPKINWIEA
jgi:hypothetical protein